MQYSFSETVKYLPWVGSEYSSGYSPGIRLLLIGESHYGDDSYQQLTRNVVNEHIEEQPNRYFTSIQQVVTGDHHSDPEFDRPVFWSRVAFYNYVQSLAGHGPRERPTVEMYSESTAAFREVLIKLEPTHLVALGFDLWNNMPEYSNTSTIGINANKPVVCEVGTYATGDSTALAIGIEHISAWGFSSSHWQDVVAHFLSLRVL